MSTQYRFGDFKLLPADRLLFRRGSEVALTARAFDLLVAFVEHAGQLLAKDELLRRVWAGLVVEENNLAVQVAALRKLLGAEAIATVPGYGYRFALAVIDVGSPPPAAERATRGPGNLTLRRPALVGRKHELAEAAALLQAHPLLTICGGPGIGKSRLAQELADQARSAHPDGAWWVDLTLLREDEPPAALLARTLGLPLHAAPDPLAELVARLAPLALLLVLDNAEHRLHDVAALADALVGHTAQLRLLVTSQAPLRSTGERLFRLEPLPLDDAMHLLAERAGSAPWHGDEAGLAGTVCRELDGNALAIELAAARVEALGLPGLATRLQQRFMLLAPGDAAQASRRNALAAAMDWSHELLGEAERRVLRRLGVFPGSFSLEAAALVLADDVVPAARAVQAVLTLVDRSLLSVERGAQPRYRLLETTRLFALDKLRAADETEAARAALAAGMRWLLEDAYEESWRTTPPEWNARYGAELPSLWAALDWAGAHDVALAAALFGAGLPLWRRFEAVPQARGHAIALAAQLSDAVPEPVRARFWLACAFSHTMVDPGQARPAAQRSAALYRRLGDARGEYMALVEYAFNWRVDATEARDALARAKAIENPGWPASVIERGLTSEAVLHMGAGRHDAARRCYIEALEVCRRGAFQPGVLRALLNRADLERAAGQLDQAVALGQALCEQLRDDEGTASLVTVHVNLQAALLAQGRHEAARQVALECRRRVSRLVLDEVAWIALDALALMHLQAGRAATAARLAGAADRQFEQHGQHQRQPNEAADRAMLDTALAAALPTAEITRLHAEGQRMSLAEAITLAFDLENPTP